MNKKYRSKNIAFLLVAVLSVGAFAGCAQNDSEEEKKVVIETMEPEESPAVSFDIIGGKDVMPIGGFYGPFDWQVSYDANATPNHLNDECFRKLSEAGINMFSQSYVHDVKLQLELAEKYGIGAFVALTTPEQSETMTDSELAEKIAEMSSYPAFIGIHVNDEPGSKVYYSEGANGGLMEDYEALCRRLSDDMEVFNMMNLLSCYDGSVKTAYELYLEQFFATCSPMVLSFDFYPFDKASLDENRELIQSRKKLYFWNLATVRKYAQRYDVPFWPYIQAGMNFGVMGVKEEVGDYYPNEGQFDWNINTCLALGAQGIQYFTLVQPPEYAYVDGVWDFEVSGLLGEMENENRWYYYAQNINKHIVAIDEVLMNSVNKGVLTIGTSEEIVPDIGEAHIKGNSWRELATAEGDAIIGCFNYQGKTALYVVNYDMVYAQKIDLTFHDTYRIKVVQDAEEKYVKTDSLTLDMKAGDGILLVFE